jgi:hypothetical protein
MYLTEYLKAAGQLQMANVHPTDNNETVIYTNIVYKPNANLAPSLFLQNTKKFAPKASSADVYFTV